MNLEKALRSIVITGLFAIPFLVLIVTASLFFPFVVGKNLYFRIIVEAIFPVWLLLMLLKHEYRPKRSAVLISTAIFVAIVALADLLGDNPIKSIWSNFERMEGLVTLLHLLAYTVMWGTIFSTRGLRVWFWRVSIGVSVIVSSHALIQFFSTDKDRLDATLGNPIYLAVYVLFHIFIAAIFAIRRSGTYAERLILSGVILLEVIVLYLTATRGASIGLVGGLLLAAAGIALTEKQDKRLKKIAGGAVLLVLVLVGTFFFMRDSSFVQNNHVLKRFAHISLTEGTVAARTLVWGIAIDGAKEKPLLGWGQENFNLVFNKYYDPRMYNEEQWFDRTHNVVFDWLIASGVLGLLSYISIFLALLWVLYKMPHGFGNPAQKWLMVGLLVAYSFHNLTVFDNIVSYVLFFSILGWIYAMSLEDSSRSSSEKDAWELDMSTDLKKYVFVGLAISTAIVLMWYVNSAAHSANKTLMQALSDSSYARAYAKVGKLTEANSVAKKAVVKYKEADGYASFGTQEVREHFVQNAARVLAASWASKEVKELYLQESMRAMQQQKVAAPKDARFPLFLSTVFASARLFDQEFEELKQALVLSPSKQVILAQMVVNSINRNKLEETLVYAQRTYELDRSYAYAAKLYAKTLQMSGMSGKANEILQEHIKLVTPQN